MSESVATTQDETTDAPVAEAVYDPSTETYADNSRVADVAGVLASLPLYQEAVKSGATEYKRFRNKAQIVAEFRAVGRGFFLRENGFPDWSADSEAYKRYVIAGETEALSGLAKADRKTFSDNVRQIVRRSALTPAVVGYIVNHEPNFGEELAMWNENRDQVMQNPSEALKARVRAHYKACGLDLTHPSFKQDTASTAPGPDPKDPANPLATLTEALGGLGSITPQYGVKGLLMAASTVAATLIDAKGSEVENRPQVIRDLERVAIITNEVAAALAATTSGAKWDDKALTKALFDPKSDQIES